jgi:hypothetical protein
MLFCSTPEQKSLGAGAVCSNARAGKGDAETLSSDVGAKRLDGGVPRLAQEATETTVAVPRNDYAAESVVQGR